MTFMKKKKSKSKIAKWIVFLLQEDKIEIFKTGTVCTYLLKGSPRCSPGNRGNSAACSKSFYSTWADSLWRLPAMPFLPVGPTWKTTRATEKPWPTVNITEPRVSRARLQVDGLDRSSILLLLLNVPLSFLRPGRCLNIRSTKTKCTSHERSSSLLPGPNTGPHRAHSTTLGI